MAVMIAYLILHLLQAMLTISFYKRFIESTAFAAMSHSVALLYVVA